MFALLRCIYEGDSYLMDTLLMAVSESAEDLENLAKAVYNHRTGNDALKSPFVLYKPGEEVPDDGQYGDLRYRCRIVKLFPGVTNPVAWVLLPSPGA